MSKVRIQITGDNPKAVEFVRLMFVGCGDDKITSYGKLMCRGETNIAATVSPT
jgi:hypothetical protein